VIEPKPLFQAVGPYLEKKVLKSYLAALDLEHCDETVNIAETVLKGERNRLSKRLKEKMSEQLDFHLGATGDTKRRLVLEGLRGTAITQHDGILAAVSACQPYSLNVAAFLLATAQEFIQGSSTAQQSSLSALYFQYLGILEKDRKIRQALGFVPTELENEHAEESLKEGADEDLSGMTTLASPPDE